MELAHGTRQVSPSAPEDFITSMPDDVITNILDHLLVKDAVRTDVWCRNCRSMETRHAADLKKILETIEADKKEMAQ
ncbi:F-box/FBD/LRR-repeat protein-like protein [Tanacetum coccineum]